MSFLTAANAITVSNLNSYDTTAYTGGQSALLGTIDNIDFRASGVGFSADSITFTPEPNVFWLLVASIALISVGRRFARQVGPRLG